MLLVFTAPTGRLFVWSQTEPPGQVDAVLVLTGGHGERQDTGARLVREGVAPVLVLPDDGRSGPHSDQLCRQWFSGVRVLCLTPKAGTTRGEAKLVI